MLFLHLTGAAKLLKAGHAIASFPPGEILTFRMDVKNLLQLYAVGCSEVPWLALCNKSKIIIIGVCAGLGGLLFLLVAIWWLTKVIKKRNDMKRKDNFFKRNGGFLLQQEVSSSNGSVEKTKLFNPEELEKATDHYNEDRILGQGG
ncbi:putative wall-associated receptor kinase-like 11 [Camellia sinensis]|uniref:putative wall-associated receptor kinase-like 11 n=1 Tax=Camellia sinensis TaxID=4442 RepID=UPI0010361C09|nr:putative wall-associated receptor kinase-like 11 [Camellia sinensis]